MQLLSSSLIVTLSATKNLHVRSLTEVTHYLEVESPSDVLALSIANSATVGALILSRHWETKRIIGNNAQHAARV